MKVGLFIVNQLHDITQAGYKVGFEMDSTGVMRLELTKPSNSDFYDAIHVIADGPRKKLEEDIIKALSEFRNIFSIPSSEKADEASDPGSEPKDGGEREEASEGDEELDNTGALA